MPHTRTLASISTAKAKETEHARLMAERFFPSYVRRVGQVINTVHRVKPAAACRLNMGVLSVALGSKPKPADLAFYRAGEARLHHCGKHRFYTYTYGQGPAVLLLHGWCSKGARWAAYAQQLVAAGFQAVVMDAPSHGQSPGRFLSVPDYIKAVGCVLRTRTDWHALITHSMGSLTGVIAASETAAANADTKFVLMNTFADCDALMSKFSRCLGISEQVLADTRQWIAEYAGRPLPYFSLHSHLDQLGKPATLLVADQKDIVVPPSETERILDAIPEIDYLSTEGLGHNLRCEKVMRHVLDFIID